MKKFLIRHRLALILFAVVVVAGFAAVIYLTITNIKPEVGQPFTVTGTAACLPHKGGGDVQTLECAIGFKADDGHYYSIRDASGSAALSGKLIFGEHQTITGILRKETSAKYVSDGQIDLSEVK